MNHRDAGKKLFHAVVVLGLATGFDAALACSSDSPAPTPSADSGASSNDAATATDAPVVDAGSGEDAFSGWAPCQ